MRVSLPTHTDVGESHIPSLLLWLLRECSSLVSGWTKERVVCTRYRAQVCRNQMVHGYLGKDSVEKNKHEVAVWLSQGWTQQMWNSCNSQGVPLLPEGACPSSLAAGLSGCEHMALYLNSYSGKTPVDWWECFVHITSVYLSVMIIQMNMSFSFFVLLWFYFGFFSLSCIETS